MKGRYLIQSRKSFKEANIYADRSSVVLNWLLLDGIDRESFTLREVALETEVSLGLVQRVFSSLAHNGFLQTKGIRTSKRFFIKNPLRLLESWLDTYSILKKCKMWSYRSAFVGKEELERKLEESKMSDKVVIALHSAAEMYGCKNTNLKTLEIYLLDSSLKSQIIDLLQLEPQERGYEVLIIEPYYKSLLSLEKSPHKNLRVSSPLLTFLDLYHFPLRGQEQAEFMAERIEELKRIYKKSS